MFLTKYFLMKNGVTQIKNRKIYSQIIFRQKTPIVIAVPEYYNNLNNIVNINRINISFSKVYESNEIIK